MLKALKHNAVMHRTWARRLALLFLIIFIAVFIMALLTIVVNENHECIGDGCPICKLIHDAERLLQEIGKTSILLGSFYAILLALIFETISTGIISVHSFTLVNTKVRLNI